MRTLVVLLEERSAKEMLIGLLSRLLPDEIKVRFVTFEGKQDLEKNISRKLQGWIEPETKFVVLRDQDSADCILVKKRLSDLCAKAGKPHTLVRIACRELESWYFGDLAAVEAGLGLDGLTRFSGKARYRIPDAIENPARELRRLTKEKYQKISGSRSIGPHLAPERNTSHSFRVFLDGIKQLAQKP